MKTKTRSKDCRKENPGLHLLYVKWATRHLTLIDKIIRELDDQGNLNLLDMTIAVHEERKNLLEHNAAYKDAQEILDLIGEVSVREPTQ